MKSRRILIFKVIGVLGVLLVIGLFILPVLRVPIERAPVGIAKNRCKNIASFLKGYYEQLEQTADEPKAAEFVKFIENQSHRSSIDFFSQAPARPLSIYEFGVYLILPKKLESNLPTLIAYTTPIKQWKTERFSRVCLFLNGTDIAATVLSDYSSVEIIGKERLEQAEPDFYYCYGK